MTETPWGRYLRRQEEVETLKKRLVSLSQEISDELRTAQEQCFPHWYKGCSFFENCLKCGKVIGPTVEIGGQHTQSVVR